MKEPRGEHAEDDVKCRLRSERGREQQESRLSRVGLPCQSHDGRRPDGVPGIAGAEQGAQIGASSWSRKRSTMRLSTSDMPKATGIQGGGTANHRGTSNRTLGESRPGADVESDQRRHRASENQRDHHERRREVSDVSEDEEKRHRKQADRRRGAPRARFAGERSSNAMPDRVGAGARGLGPASQPWVRPPSSELQRARARRGTNRARGIAGAMTPHPTRTPTMLPVRQAGPQTEASLRISRRVSAQIRCFLHEDVTLAAHRLTV